MRMRAPVLPAGQCPLCHHVAGGHFVSCPTALAEVIAPAHVVHLANDAGRQACDDEPIECAPSDALLTVCYPCVAKAVRASRGLTRIEVGD